MHEDSRKFEKKVKQRKIKIQSQMLIYLNVNEIS